MRYFVDSAMLGDGGNDELEKFCRILQSLTEVQICSVCDSYNGADNSLYDGPDVPWDQAMEIYANR
jgi:hypothetical protein